MTLKDTGKLKKTVIIATGHSYLNIDYSKIPDDFIRIEINKMRVDTRIDYSIYYDSEYKEYFENKVFDRKLISFEVHKSTNTNYTFNVHTVPFSDSGFHALYIASQIMNCLQVFLIGYDYKLGADGSFHPYKDEPTSEELRQRKIDLFDKQIKMYNTINWNAKVFNCNKDSDLKLFEFRLPYKN